VDGGGAERGLTDFLEAIEAHLRRRRGADHALSPRDFALARSWHEAGVSLAVVLVGIDRTFEESPDAASLAFCRRRVEELAAAGPLGRAAGGSSGERATPADVAEVLGLLKERLAELPRAGFALALHRTEEVLDLLAVAARPNWDYLRRKLAEVDEEASAAALESLSREEAAQMRAEAARAAERHRGCVSPEALDDAVSRLVRQRARERFRLPRVAIG
jgi:hypothetical protein